MATNRQPVHELASTYGDWTVVSHERVTRRAMVLCRCSCGTERLVRPGDLLTGRTASCGCKSGEKIGRKLRGRPRLRYYVKHGMHDTPEHRAWTHLKSRCFNPRSQRFDRYGARGITVCQRWKDSFEAFYEDMGPRPSPEHSIEREDNDGNYEPGNCRWATREEQNANKSTSRIIEHEGESHTASWWAKEKNLGAKTLVYRLDAGWPIKDALERPAERRRWTKSPRGSGGAIPPSHDGPSNRRVLKRIEASDA